MEPREALYNVTVDTIVYQDIKPSAYSIELLPVYSHTNCDADSETSSPVNNFYN